MQKIRFENGLAVAKSKIEYVMCRIEEIRLQLQGTFHFIGTFEKSLIFVACHETEILTLNSIYRDGEWWRISCKKQPH